MILSASEPLIFKYFGQNSRQLAAHFRYFFSCRKRNSVAACAAEQRPATRLNAWFCPRATPRSSIPAASSVSSIIGFSMTTPIHGDHTVVTQKMEVIERERFTQNVVTTL